MAISKTTKGTNQKTTVQPKKPVVVAKPAAKKKTVAKKGKTSATPAGAPANTDDVIRQQFGYLAWALNIPELAGKLKEAAAGHWGADQTEAAIESTNWWRTNSDTVRSYLKQQMEDPASQAQSIAQKVADIQSQAQQLGVTIDPNRLNQMASDALKFGWDSSQLQQNIGAEFHYDPTKTYEGAVGAAIQNFKKGSYDYVIPMSDATINDWAQQVAEGKMDPNDQQQYFINQAKSMFPTIDQHYLDSGGTVQQYMDPYRQLAAQKLNIDPSSVDFFDSKWNAPLTQIDPTTNQRTVMSLADWQTKLQTDSKYGFDQTADARQQASQLATSLGQMMGAIG